MNTFSFGAAARPQSVGAAPVVFSLRNYRYYAFEIVLTSFVVNAISLCFPIFTMVVYNKVVGNHVSETLWALAIGTSILLFVEFVIRCTRAYFIEHISTRWDHLFDQRVLAASLATPLDKLPDVGTLMHRYRDTLSSRDFLSSAYLVGLADIPFLPFYVIALAVVGSWTAMVPAAVGVVLYVWIHICHHISQAYYKASVPAASAKMESLAASLAAGEVLRLRGATAGLKTRLSAASDVYALLQARSRYWSALGANGGVLLMAIAAVATIVMGVGLIERQELSMGGLIATSMLVGRTLAVVQGIAHSSAKFHDFRDALTRLTKALPGIAQFHIDADAPPPKAGNRSAPAIQLENVSYRYGDRGRVVLKDVDLKIEPGSRVAILGRSGSGKSTLLRLLAGLVSPTVGSVSADFFRIEEGNQEVLRESVALKPQDLQLLPGTVMTNIGTGAAGDEAKVQVMLESLGLDKALATGELSLNSQVGESGRYLSGGQRQLVSIARALHLKRPVLILDEPTLGLDRASQAALYAVLKALPPGVTVILTCHSNELLSLMDRVVVMDGGRKVADGLRDEILVPAKRVAAQQTTS